MHKEIAEKRERIAKMNAEKSVSLTSTECQDKTKEEEDENKKKRVTKMVVVNAGL
jgi:hypothetical protein